jgi:hypothetical protein
MSQRSDISASIQQNFPDNSAQFITPTRLRSEQGLFEQYSVLNEQTASIIAQAVASSSANPVDTGSLVTTASFNAYTASTNTFTGSIQTQVNALRAATASYATTGSNTFNGTNTFTGSLNAESASITFLTVGTIVSSSTIFSSGSNTLGDAANDVQTLFGTVDIKTGPLKVSGSADISGSLTVNGNSVVLSSQTSSFLQNSQTSSFVTNAQTSSFVTSDITGSSLITASVSLNTITFTKGDGSTFPLTVDTGSGGGGTGSAFPFTGSAQISGSLTISNDTDGVVFDIKQPNHSTESIYSIRMGNQADVTESIAVGGNLLLSGSFNNTYRIVIPTTINDLTGSLLGTASYATVAGNGMNLGANTFTGSQTIQSQSLFLQASSSVALNTNFFTASTAGATDGANIYLFVGSANSGSTIISGSRNIGTVNPGTNMVATTRRGGFNGSGNFGVFSSTYSTASSAPTLANNFLVSGIANLMTNASSSVAVNGNFVGGAITVTGSATSTVNIISNNIDSVTIENNFTGSGASQNVSVNNSLIKGGQAGNIAFIKFASTGSGTNARSFSSNILFGSNITASMEASGTNQQNLFNTAVIGSGLIVSGTMIGSSLSASMFVGQYNETGSLADPSQIKFAVGTGTSNTARETAFYVLQSGLTVMKDSGFISGALTIESPTDVSAFNLTQNGNSAYGIVHGGGLDTSIVIPLNATQNYQGAGNNLFRFDAPTRVNSSFIVSGSTTITGSVAITGSLRVNGNLQYNYGEFWMSSSQTPSAGVSQSVVFDSTGHSVGVAISGSGALIKVTNGGTYNIQFSAQINASAGTDTMWMWFKKNGTNIAASNSKAVLANNTSQLITVNIIDTATANDYYEIAYQNNAGNAQILSEAASGNYPSIPGVILTVTQVA